MKRKKVVLLLSLFTIACVGCSAGTSGEDNALTPSPVPSQESTDSGSRVQVASLSQTEVAVEPEIKEYSFAEAKEKGTVLEMDGVLPGASEGTWYIAQIDGVEYYYGIYDSAKEVSAEDSAELMNYAIRSEDYTLTNGICVGMTKTEVLEICPDMASVDFEDNVIGSEVFGHSGWNGQTYPRSYVGMDSDWEYQGEDYRWTDQFDYVMIADIEQEAELPLHMGLLMVDDAVVAITFFYPTAG